MITIRDAGGACSCNVGTPVARVRTRISIGFSNTVFRGSTFVATAFFGSGLGVLSLIACSVMSARGVPGTFVGSGEAEGLGVGNWESSSGAPEAIEIRDFLPGFTLFLFEGDLVLEGEGGSVAVVSGVNSCVGSIESPVRILLVLVAVFGVAGSSAVFLRGALRALF